jgi:hypothetical protein
MKRRDDVRAEVDAHRRVLEGFLAVAEGVDAEAWNVPAAEGKWSPAQVVDHLRVTYTVVRQELAGGEGARVRTPWWRRLVLRRLFLPRILESGRFPEGVPAVREIRPGPGPFDRLELLAALRREGERFLADAEAAAATAGAGITHPFLGRLGVGEGVRFTAQHVRHHQAQVAGAARPLAAAAVTAESAG